MQRLTRDHRIYFLDPENPPAITIDSGEELVVETWDAFEGTQALSRATPCGSSS
jgi:amidase